MSNIQMISVPALEYVALQEVDKMVRLAMTTPGAGEFLAVAIQALDAVRADLGILVSGPVIDVKPQSAASDLATGLIQRAMVK